MAANRSRNHSLLPSYALAILLIANLFLSANAIRCHQCNSHLDEDCVALRLSTPKALRDNQYLKECEGEQKASFCRKTVISLEVSGEHRIVRSCGWVNDDIKNRNTSSYCYNADNEGYQQTICACMSDGCNSAPVLGTSSKLMLVISGLYLAIAFLLQRNS